MRQIRDGEDIRKWREELKLTLRDIEEQSGIDKTYIWTIEKGRVQPRKTTISKIQKALEYYQEKQNQLMGDGIDIEESISNANTDKYKNHAILSLKLTELLDAAYRQGGKEREEQVTAVLHGYIQCLLDTIKYSGNN